MDDLTDYVMDKVELEFWNGERWVYVGDFPNEKIAWLSLGDDNEKYRTISCNNGSVIREN